MSSLYLSISNIKKYDIVFNYIGLEHYLKHSKFKWNSIDERYFYVNKHENVLFLHTDKIFYIIIIDIPFSFKRKSEINLKNIKSNQKSDKSKCIYCFHWSYTEYICPLVKF